MIEHDDDFSDWDAIIAGEEDPFDLGGVTFEWRTKTHHTVQRDADGRPIAHVGLLLAEVEAGGEAFAVVGVGVVVQQSTGELALQLPAMWRPLREGVTWPAGEVRVPGLPF